MTHISIPTLLINSLWYKHNVQSDLSVTGGDKQPLFWDWHPTSQRNYHLNAKLFKFLCFGFSSGDIIEEILTSQLIHAYFSILVLF